VQEWNRLAYSIDEKFVPLFDKVRKRGPVLSKSDIDNYKKMIDDCQSTYSKYKNSLINYEDDNMKGRLTYAVEKMNTSISCARFDLDKEIKRRYYYISGKYGINGEFEDITKLFRNIDDNIKLNNNIASETEKINFQTNISKQIEDLKEYKDDLEFWRDGNGRGDGVFENDPEMIKKINDTIKTIEEYIAKMTEQKKTKS